MRRYQRILCITSIMFVGISMNVSAISSQKIAGFNGNLWEISKEDVLSDAKSKGVKETEINTFNELQDSIYHLTYNVIDNVEVVGLEATEEVYFYDNQLVGGVYTFSDILDSDLCSEIESALISQYGEADTSSLVSPIDDKYEVCLWVDEDGNSILFDKSRICYTKFGSTFMDLFCDYLYLNKLIGFQESVFNISGKKLERRSLSIEETIGVPFGISQNELIEELEKSDIEYEYNNSLFDGLKEDENLKDVEGLGDIEFQAIVIERPYILTAEASPTVFAYLFNQEQLCGVIIDISTIEGNSKFGRTSAILSRIYEQATVVGEDEDLYLWVGEDDSVFFIDNLSLTITKKQSAYIDWLCLLYPDLENRLESQTTLVEGLL